MATTAGASGSGNTAFGGGSGIPTGGSAGKAGSAGAAGSLSAGGAGGGSAGTGTGAGGAVSTCGASATLCAAGQTCATNADCTSTQCIAKKCAPDHCGNTTMDGDETDKNCGGSCAPCAEGLACLAATDCATKNCTAMMCGKSQNCLFGWKGSGACDTCSTQTQSDHQACSVVLDCYVTNSCTPSTCGTNDQVCGQNTLQTGGAAFDVALTVYNCLCPAM
jgi:hypothetical protein